MDPEVNFNLLQQLRGLPHKGVSCHHLIFQGEIDASRQKFANISDEIIDFIPIDVGEPKGTPRDRHILGQFLR